MAKKVQTRQWTQVEDEALIKAVMADTNKKKNWISIAQSVPNRSNIQCRQRWENSLAPEIVKGKWTEDQDNELRRLVELHSTDSVINWTPIAHELKGRSVRQIRTRWELYLDPNIIHGPFSGYEIEVMEQEFAVRGNNWAEIARVLPGRTTEQVKKEFMNLHPDFKADKGRPAQKRSRGSQALAKVSKNPLHDEKDYSESLQKVLLSFGSMDITETKKPRIDDLLEWLDCAYDSNEPLQNISEDILSHEGNFEGDESELLTKIIMSFTIPDTEEDNEEVVTTAPPPPPELPTIDINANSDDDDDIGDSPALFYSSQ